MPGIEELSRNVLAKLADGSVRAVLLVLIAALALRIGRVKRPAVQHVVWTVAVFCMLLSPFVRIPAPQWELKWDAPEAVLPAPQVSGVQSGAEPAGRKAPAAPARSSLDWTLGLAVFYAAGVACMIVRLAIAYRATRRLRTAPLLEEQGLHESWQDACARMSLAWPLPEVRQSEAVTIPLVSGWRAPVLLLPPDWRTWNRDKLRAVLLHEAAHVRRQDSAATALALINCCAFWFHPLAWWMARRLPALAEHAADDAAVACGIEPRQYAEIVLSFARIASSGRRVLLGASAMARRGNVGRRIDRILEGPRSLGFATGRTWLIAIAIGVPVVFATAAMQVSASPQRQLSAPVPAPDTLDLLGAGYRMTAAQAAEAEARLRSDPHDLTTRAQLIAYYFMNAIPSPRLEHIFWIIENHPESWVPFSYPAKLSATSVPMNSAADYERAKALWLEQVARHGNEPHILANAAHFLQESDVATALRLLKQAHQIDPENANVTERLILAYGRVLSREWEIVASTTRPNSTVDPALRTQVQAELESSADASVVGGVGEWLGMARVVFSPALEAAHALSEIRSARNELAQRLLERAMVLEPQNERWQQAMERLRNPPPPTARPQMPQGIRVGGNVQQAMLIESQPPMYPPLARQARIQGTVRLDVQIGKDGAVVNVKVAGGHPLLVPAAMEAVKSYRYKPTLLNGQPVEVLTQVDVPFQLDSNQ